MSLEVQNELNTAIEGQSEQMTLKQLDAMVSQYDKAIVMDIEQAENLKIIDGNLHLLHNEVIITFSSRALKQFNKYVDVKSSQYSYLKDATIQSIFIQSLTAKAKGALVFYIRGNEISFIKLAAENFTDFTQFEPPLENYSFHSIIDGDVEKHTKVSFAYEVSTFDIRDDQYKVLLKVTSNLIQTGQVKFELSLNRIVCSNGLMIKETGMFDLISHQSLTPVVIDAMITKYLNLAASAQESFTAVVSNGVSTIIEKHEVEDLFDKLAQDKRLPAAAVNAAKKDYILYSRGENNKAPELLKEVSNYNDIINYINYQAHFYEVGLSHKIQQGCYDVLNTLKAA